MFPGHVALTHPDKPAVIMARSGKTITYAQLDRSANKISQLLYSAGLRPGDNVAICLENHEKFFDVVWGCHYAGLIYTACSSRLTADELTYIVNDCGAKALITSAYLAPQVSAVADKIPRVTLRLMIDGTIEGFERLEDAVVRASSEPLRDRVDGSDMLYSSGTTGRPKGVRLATTGSPLGTPVPLVGLGQFLLAMDDQMVYLSPAPLYHAAPLRWNMVVHRLEGNGFVYCNSESWLAHQGTVGQALNAVIHICDDEGNELPTGESGTVYFESNAHFEYHNDPEKTKASRDPLGRGWTTLGDIGYLDDDKFLYLTDRKAFMIISGGVNIYPQESENVLINHPKVTDVAVFGIPHEEFGEEVKAVVQPLAMPSSDDERRLLEQELIAYCKQHLADLKCPRSVDFRPELPRHPTGKLYKRLLKDEYWAAAGRSI
ncbi:MAG: acyl-CoA synthetase [Actinobacteria bacterium]|nr:acyl-CoA synthetase [Actinomycetota bacterium]